MCADIHNPNIPALTNQIANDIPDIKENLEFHKDVLQQIGTGWSDSDATAFASNKWTMSAITGSCVLSTGVMFANVSTAGGHAGVRLSAAAANILYVVKQAGTAGITISTATGTIDGSANIALSQNDECMGLEFDGTNYHKIFHHKAESDLPWNYLTGLIMSVSATDVQDIEVGTGQATDSTNGYNITLSAALIKRLDAAWGAGTNAGGVADSGTMSVGVISTTSWLHVFAIKDTSTGSVDIGLDEDITASNLLHASTVLSAFTGTLAYRRIGSLKGATGGAAASIESFVQNGDEFLWKDPPLDFDGSTSTTAQIVSLTVMPDVACEAIINAIQIKNSNTPDSMYISPTSVNDEAPSVSAAPLCQTVNRDATAENHYSAMGPCRIRVDTSRQIRIRGTSGITNTRIATLGWIDRRGRDG